ncbi:hypothetical protein FKP32DRAFT_1571013 [Trametes sanguinea]|nr:hypothetical protein FKP32DRAFT_1571013 [Trametes sanguinea]
MPSSTSSADPHGPVSLIIINDHDWPPWVREAFDYIESKSLGPIMLQALEWWTVLERCYGWESSTKGLDTAYRPPQVAVWLRILRRNIKRSPDINDEQEYAKMWQQWWVALQPPWRELDENGWPAQVGDGEWECLVSPGKNGLLIVLLSLVWWHEVATDQTLSLWTTAISDVAWVITTMAAAAFEA